jgi:hypothetical protein
VIEFDLVSALAGKAVVTRDGRPAVVAAVNLDAPPFNQVVGWVGPTPASWSRDGKMFQDKRIDSEWDIFMADETKG